MPSDGKCISETTSLIASAHVLKLVEILLFGQIYRVENDPSALIMLLCLGVVDVHVVGKLVWSDVGHPVNGHHVAGFGPEKRGDAEATDVWDGVIAHNVSDIVEHYLQRLLN